MNYVIAILVSIMIYPFAYRVVNWIINKMGM